MAGAFSVAMQQKIISLGCALLIVAGSAVSSHAGTTPTAEAVVADVFIARPACFIATVLGSVAFVVALPFAALSKSVDKTANTLVVVPANLTFKRSVGDLKALGL